MEVVASLSEGRTAAAHCGLFTHKSVPVIFEPPCIFVCALFGQINDLNSKCLDCNGDIQLCEITGNLGICRFHTYTSYHHGRYFRKGVARIWYTPRHVCPYLRSSV